MDRVKVTRALAVVRVKAHEAAQSARRFAPALLFMLALGLGMLLGAHGAFAQSGSTSTVVSLPPTDSFDSTFTDVQTWATAMITGPGKYGIYIMLSFIGLGLVIGWIRKSVKVH